MDRGRTSRVLIIHRSEIFLPPPPSCKFHMHYAVNIDKRIARIQVQMIMNPPRPRENAGLRPSDSVSNCRRPSGERESKRFL